MNKPFPAISRSTRFTGAAFAMMLATLGVNAQAQSMPTTPVPGATAPGLAVGEGSVGQPMPGAAGHRHHGDRNGGMMKRIDLDRDGTISRNELIAAHQKQLQAFDAADTNRDGKLSADEMKAFQQQMRGRPQG